MKIVGMSALLLVTLVTSYAVADNVYKSVDENGNLSFSDRPIDGTWEETIELDIRATNVRELEQGQQRDAELRKAASIREAQEAEDVADEAADRATVAAQRASNCKAAKARENKYNTNRKLYKPMPDGGREYLSSDEIDAARADAARSVDEWCS